MLILPNKVVFHDGNTAPQLGLGVWQIEPEHTASIVCSAIEHGYRLVDTAAIYDNEREVGQGLRDSGIKREDLFVSSKVWNDSHGHDSTKEALYASLDKLQLDYIDLYLIHWPVPQNRLYVQTWEMLINLRNEGLIKSIGVCNFNEHHLQTLLDKTGVLPVLNQIELHPGFQQSALRQFHLDHSIHTQAWSPMGFGQFWDDSVLQSLADKHNKSIAQIILRWQMQLGNLALTKSTSLERLQENMDIFSFSLDHQDLLAIQTLNQDAGRIGPDPEVFLHVA